MALTTSGSALRPRKYCAHIAIGVYTPPGCPRGDVSCVGQAWPLLTIDCCVVLLFISHALAAPWNHIGVRGANRGGPTKHVRWSPRSKQENTLAASLSPSLGRFPAVHIPPTGKSWSACLVEIARGQLPRIRSVLPAVFLWEGLRSNKTQDGPVEATNRHTHTQRLAPPSS